MAIIVAENLPQLKLILEDCVNLNIYGAGAYSDDILDFLQDNNIKPNYIIVSEKNKDSKNNIPIISLKKALNFNDDFVIIAVSDKYKDEILENLLKNQFNKIITITNACYNNIKLFLRKTISFQTHIVEHCNLKCSGCYHFSSLAKEEYLSIDEFNNDIKRLAYLLDGKVNELLLLGGEPLLHPKVGEFFYIARKFFPIGKVKMLTNGLLLQRMDREFFNAIKENNAELWVTKYPVKYDYEAAEKYSEEFDVKLNYFNQEPVRSLGHQPLDLSGKQDYQKNFYSCYRANHCIDLKHGKIYPCIIPAEIKPFCDYFSIEISVSSEDYIDIYKIKSKEELIEKLSKPIPFCRYCNRKNIAIFGAKPWKTTDYNIREWTD